MEQFSIQDAQSLIAAARMAPLANMQAAEQLNQIINRFTDHCVQQFAAPSVVPPPPDAVS